MCYTSVTRQGLIDSAVVYFAEDDDNDNNDDGEVKHSDRSLFVLRRCHIFTHEHNYAACLSCEQADAGCVGTADYQMYNSSLIKRKN